MRSTEVENFGSGHLGSAFTHPNSFKSAETRMNYVAGRGGCPVREKTREREMKKVALAEKRQEHWQQYRQQGSVEAERRYSRYMTFHQMTLNELSGRVKGERTEWYGELAADHLTGYRPRRSGQELVGYEKGSIPKWVIDFIPDSERYVHYTLSRLLSSYVFDWGSEVGTEYRQETLSCRFANAFHYLNMAIDLLDKKNDHETNANILVMATAEYMVSHGKIDKEKVLGRLFSKGKMDQDSFYIEYTQALRTMETLEKRNPMWRLARSYWKMSKDNEKLKELGVADPFYFVSEYHSLSSDAV